nr:YgzB family protein [Kyrpidia tusciae]
MDPVKLNRLRNIALLLMLVSFAVMYLGVFWPHTVLPFTLAAGFLILMWAIGIYFRVGAVSMRLPQVECPNCHRITKMIGREDGCMYCGTPVHLPEEQQGPR